VSDEPKPKGLDLGKLLKKKAPDAPANEPAAQPLETPPVAQAKPKGLDMAKLLAKAKPAEPAQPRPGAGVPSQEALSEVGGGADASSTDASRVATSTQSGTPMVAKPVAPANPFVPPKPPRPEKVVAPTKPLNSAAPAVSTAVVKDPGTTRFVASVEESASREGKKDLALDLTVAEQRKYPLGFYGFDEIFVQCEHLADTVRRHLYRLRDEHKEGFSVAYRIVGAHFMSFGLVWDGKTLHELDGALPENPTVSATVDADMMIDQVRGRFTCIQTSARNTLPLTGDVLLLYWLGIRIEDGMDPAMLKVVHQQDEARREEGERLRKAARDPIDAFSRLLEWRMRPRAEKMVEPLFMRAKARSGAQAVELLFHFENQKLTVLRGKPGETLVQGALELEVDEVALRALYEGEADIYFLMLARHITFSGDLNLLEDTGVIANRIALEAVKHVHRSGKVLSRQNRLPKSPLKLQGPAKDPYLLAL
jgi:hypothetical protein